jgi:hydroxymethylpyrimidine pyrophosphatase-like HAD family hydrolase/fructoselysine-6-P-deglycase FrlB-like protein
LGKPYASELSQLSSTYQWAATVPNTALAKAVAAIYSTSLLVVGSGGSLSAAQFVASQHERFSGEVARAVTPLEIVSAVKTLRRSSVMFLSAGGTNPDVIGAFKQTVLCEPRRLIVVSARKESPLSLAASSFRYVDTVDLSFPLEKDGFLATNTLLAFMMLTYRAYSASFGEASDLPENLEELVHPGVNRDVYVADLRAKCLSLWQRKYLVVLYGPSAHTAAVDIESKFTEAALGATLLADYRNFAHGRHHWLAKCGDTTGVLAFITKDDAALAEKTLDLIPSNIPIARVGTSHSGAFADLCLLVSTLHIVGLAGEAHRIDPGRPGVPSFGRKIYHLRAFARPSAAEFAVGIAIERKTQAAKVVSSQAEVEYWQKAYEGFVRRLVRAQFRYVVLDYDGTLCDEQNRYTGLDEAMVGHLRQMLESGNKIGIATGRGKSVRKDLRAKFRPELWPQILIGYYNGAEIGFADDDNYPHSGSSVCNALQAVSHELQLDPQMAIWADCTYRRFQITIEPKFPTVSQAVWDRVEQIVNTMGPPGVALLTSSHSLDVIAPGISKKKLVSELLARDGASADAPVLCVGDRGRFPGNDYALLDGPYSLSVDEVSNDPDSCWNLAPAGIRGVQAMEHYLSCLKYTSAGFRLQFR